ncbi:Fe2+-enterobactin ABC transporter substrate-binding protein [Corynebacterium casei]|uniref:Fe2+-enterobactin ABC transporter substrate-binding protein n=1 Tax=Corynebacterium casei TaxID=160386 RepID=UPI002648A81D|nr:Fe2+-enterobactin ABC transporter substrate-binding protein [Corynebacterium casei]MDN6263517.1 Fe2+-enterobactin ABC transporter substrate-binding protein [Corynebacterium casei]
MTLVRGRKLVKAAASALLAGALIGSLAACSSEESGATSTEDSAASGEGSAEADSGEWPRTIETDNGELTLESQPERIVSTSVTLTGSLLAVDAPVVASGATGENVEDLSDENGFFIQWSDEAKEAGVEKLWDITAPDAEKAVGFAPDLIVVSKNSGDSAFDQIDRLEQIAPVLVVDYSDASWQDVTTKIGEATGHEEGAAEVIADFDERIEEASEQIELPEGKTSSFIVFGDGSGAAALTPEAPQNQILSRLGFDLTEVPEEVKGDLSMGADRGDIISLAIENIQAGLPGENWILVSSDKENQEMIQNEPAFNTSPAVKEGRVYHTPASTFRLDYFSANILVDSIVEQFAK